MILELIKAALWGGSPGSVGVDDFEELSKHSIILLTAPVFNSYQLSDDLRVQWERTIFQQIAYNVKYNREQASLPITVPYVILKGSSVAKYYTNPLFRLMGDIDIMTKRGVDFDNACDALIQSGYIVKKKLNREIGLVKNGVLVEVHRSFASLNNVEQAKYMDDLIIDNINSTHVLPDLINGLVILEHISQHLENGLGLRQIIDWMMFAYRCLPEEKWPEFQALAKNIGLETLAIITTRMCELYLGLPERNWCKSADIDLCERLMDYILSCGNFGVKRKENGDISEDILTKASSPKAAFKMLQQRGEVNWEAAKKHGILRPFAWIYQVSRYIDRGLNRENALIEFKQEFVTAKKRKEMLDALGVKQRAKGLVVYKDGKYYKK